MSDLQDTTITAEAPVEEGDRCPIPWEFVMRMCKGTFDTALKVYRGDVKLAAQAASNAVEATLLAHHVV